MIHSNWSVCHFNAAWNRIELTDGVDFVGELSGAEGAGVRGDALVEQVDDVAVPASLCHMTHTQIAVGSVPPLNDQSQASISYGP